MSALDLPECNFTFCPVCLPDAGAKANFLNLIGIDGLAYDVPFRIGRPTVSWESASMMGQIVGILASEKLDFAVEYRHCLDEVHCLMAVMNCIGWENYECDLATTTEEFEAATKKMMDTGDGLVPAKHHPDPIPDILFQAEIWPSANDPSTYDGMQLVWGERESIDLGPLGWLTQDGLYVLGGVVDAAWANERLSFNSYQPYTTDKVLPYLATPQRLMDAGVTAEKEGCNASNIQIQNSMNRRWATSARIPGG